MSEVHWCLHSNWNSLLLDLQYNLRKEFTKCLKIPQKTTKTINIRFNSKIQHCQIQEENPTAKCFLTVLLAQLPKSACKKHSMLTGSVEPNTLFQILNQHYFCWRLQHGGHTKHSFLFQSDLYQCDAAALAHLEKAHTGYKSLPGVTNTSSGDPDLQGGTTLHWSPEGSR